jgi:Fe-S-cluster-containing dehydrogenase component/CRP-like cAMP-binding protein
MIDRFFDTEVPMSASTLVVDRPQRWEVPFGETMTESNVDELMAISPFSRMNEARFPKNQPLRGILLNDTRIVRFQPGEVILREGDYGNSAFLVLNGKVRIVLRNLPRKSLGRAEPSTKTWWQALMSIWRDPKYPEIRAARSAKPAEVSARGGRIFLQDIPSVLGPDDTTLLGRGEVFGELAALTRTPRTATVLADGEVEVLEIRWQGLRDILRTDSGWRAHVDHLYRDNSLRVHLRETPLLANISPEHIDALALATQFASYGDFEWHRSFRKAEREEEVGKRIEYEPVIAQEGDYPDGLILIRSGFARLSVRNGTGHRTLAYLGKGDIFGLKEMNDLANGSADPQWSASLRAIGYVDVLRIPTRAVHDYIFPSMPAELRVPAVPASPVPLPSSKPDTTGLLEFLVDHRFGNGTEAMVIDLDRCTRCDDCVKACAATHDGNPRFNREGPQYGRLMIAHACMHCVDPVCMIGCPTGAIARDDKTGAVVINDDTCIGCTTCAQSCPYTNIRMVGVNSPSGQALLDESGSPLLKATKCDLCTGMPGGPACQNACPHDALVRLDLRTPDVLGQWRGA